jgi:hypothetical protein
MLSRVCILCAICGAAGSRTFSIAALSVYATADVAVGGSAGSFRSNNALHPRGLIVERLSRSGRRMLGKETITVACLYASGSAGIAAARMQAFTRRDNRQVRRHHPGFAQLMLFHAMTPAFMAATAKVFG